MPGDKIFLKRKVTRQGVTIPERKFFLARFERLSRKNLPVNVLIKRIGRIGPRRQRKQKAQQGAGSVLESVFILGKNLLNLSILKRGFDISSRALNLEISKKILAEGIK